MPLAYLVFVSSSVGELADTALENILASSRRRNEERGITGVLLYHEGSFFHYFEGPGTAVDEVYAHVRRSTWHHGIIELDRGVLPRRQFAGWHMGLTHPSKSEPLALASAGWAQLARLIDQDAGPSHGLALLLDFWRTARGAYA